MKCNLFKTIVICAIALTLFLGATLIFTTSAHGETAIPEGAVENSVDANANAIVSNSLPQVTVEDASVRVGESVMINIILSGAPELESLAISDILYDTDAFEFVSLEWKLQDAILSHWDEKTGKGAIAFSSPADLNGTIISISLKVKDEAADGIYPISCTVRSQECYLANVGGEITVYSYMLGDVDGNETVNKDDAVHLLMHSFFPEDYPINQWADYNRNGAIGKGDAIYLLMYTFFPEDYPLVHAPEKPEQEKIEIDFTTLDYIIRDWKSQEAVSAEDYNELFTNTVEVGLLSATGTEANDPSNYYDMFAKAYYAKLFPITENSYYELTFKVKNNRVGGYCGFVFAADAENHPWFVYGGLNNHADHDSAESELRARYRYYNNDGSIGSQLSDTVFKKALDLDEAGFASYKVVYEGLTATVYALADGEWVQVVFGDMEAFTLTAGSSVAIGMYNRHGNADRQRTITIADAAIVAIDNSQEEPTGIVDTIIANETPMYSISATGELTEVPFKLLNFDTTTASAEPTESGFYQITDSAGNVIESGYQELQIRSDETYYVIALPKEIDYHTMVTMQAYSTALSKWMDAENFNFTNESTKVAAICAEAGIDISAVDTEIYSVWAVDECPTGSKLRFIITE